MALSPPLACTVRDCGLWLEPRPTSFVCARGHSYDVARAGYVNLLQPQDRRSLVAGDTKDVVAARSRLLASGVGAHVVDGFIARAITLALGVNTVVVDLGCGGGEVLGEIATERSIVGVGIDLSTAAIEQAARVFSGPTWVVANADRRLPILDRSVDLLLSLHGRRNPSECARVLAHGGRLLVGVPAHDDLNELRESVQGRAIIRDRSDALIQEHSRHFFLIDRFSLRARQRVDRATLMDVLMGTYRGARRSSIGRIEALTSLDVTLATDVFVFALAD